MKTLSTTTLKTTDVRSRISPELNQGIPFAIKMPNPETQRAMLEAREMKEGRFSDTKDLINDIQKNSRTIKNLANLDKS